MADMFKNYAELSAVYVEGTDYKVTLNKKSKDIGVTAYHGGGIEIGSTELLQYIYEKRTTWSWYGFEGLLSADNGNLHITSTNFDEPRGMDFIGHVNRAVSLHGASGDTPITYIGGMDVITRTFIKSKLEAKGFVVQYASTESGIAGEQPNNFVNRPPKGGVQLEMTSQLRKNFFLNGDWSKSVRTNKANWTQTMKDYGDAVIEGVELALALKLIGSGQLSLVDLNDAIVSGTEPTNPSVGTLWVDESVTPKMLKKWNGTSWDEMGELDPNLSETITDIQETLGNMANDDVLDFQERQIIKDKLLEIIGYTAYDKTPFLSTYANKTTGSNTANPHNAKYVQSATNPNPTSGGTEFAQSSYDAIKTLNNTHSSVGSINSNTLMAHHLFSINVIAEVEKKYGTIPKSTTADKVAWLKSNISKFSINWYGYGTSATGNKATLKRWDGSAWVVCGTNTASTYTLINGLPAVATSIQSDGFFYAIAHAEASNGTTASTVYTDYIELEITMVDALPTSATLDGIGYGDFYNTRTSARLAGISTADVKYVALATKYTALKTYLDGLTPIDPWDTTVTNRDKIINVTKSAFRNAWLDYYNSAKDLITATQEQLKKNVDNIENGGTNYGSNGNFEMDITKSLWKDSYVGNTVEVVDIGTEEPPHSKALHVKNTTAVNGGIFQPTIFDGKTAEALTGKQITVSYWLKYQNIVQGSQVYNSGRFGELIIRGVASDGTYKYEYIRIGATNVFDYTYTTGTNMTWARYSATAKIPIPTGALRVDRITFKHGIENCTGEFWTTGIMIELGNKASDWKQSPIDLQMRLTDVEFKISDDQVITKITTSQKYLSDFAVVNKRLDNSGVGGENLVDNSDLKVKPVMWNNAIGTLVEGTGGQPNSILVEKANGYNSYAFSLFGTSKFLKDQTYTISFEAKTNGTIDQFNYIYVRGNGVANFPIPTPIIIDKTNTTDFVPYSVTFVPTYDLPANAGVLIGTNGWTAPFEVRKVKIERGEKSTGWTRSQTDMDNIINASLESGSMVTNSTFASWGSTHSKFPTGMTSWGASTPTRELVLTKNGGNALRYTGIGTNDAGANLGSGFFKSNLANAKYIMVELDFYVVSGTDLSGAGIVLDWTGMTTYRRIHKLQEMVGETITTGKWYSARKVFLRPSDTLTGYTNMSGYLMANYSSIGTKADKDIIFDRLTMREATAEEIKAYSADLTIADMMSDMKVTPIEKSTLKQTWDNIQAEYADLISQASKSAVTYSVYDGAYSALNGTTPKISSEILSSMTTTYTFASTTARDAFKTKLNTYYNEALRLRRTIAEITASPRNLILNSTFNQTDDDGKPMIWKDNSFNTKWSVKDPEETSKSTSSILYAGTTTGNATNVIYSAHSNWFPVKQGEIFTFTVDFKTTSATAWDVKIPFIVEFWDSATTATRVQYKDVSNTDLGVSTVADNTWYRASYTVQVTASTATRGRIRLCLARNGDLFIREVQVQRGNKATDYEYAPEDTSTQIFLLESRVSDVQQVISGSGIVDTIMNSVEYQLAMDGKANAESLANYATNEELEEGISGAKSYAEQKVADIDFTPYVKTTEFSRTADDITAKFKSGGGINMLRNSIGFSGYDFWTPYTNAGTKYPLGTMQNEELDKLGFSSGFVTYKTSTTQYLRQEVSTVIGQQYTFSFYLNKTADASTNAHAGVDILQSDGTTMIRWLGLGANSGTTNGYQKFEHTFTAVTSTTIISLTGGANAEAVWTGVMFNIGDQPFQWSMHPQEVYNTNIQMDLNGIKVVQLDGGVPSGLTVMTPSRFAGYYDVDGNGTVDTTVGGVDEVFRVDKDEFVMKKAVVKEEITMGTIKVIKIQSTASTGWAFVSNKTS